MNDQRASHARPQRWLALAALCFILYGTASAGEPLLWRVEGDPPTYLFGTIHLPDARVTALPDVVQRAFDESDAVFTEIVLDAATQASMLGKVSLPEGQSLKTLAGEELFSRFVRVFVAGLGDNIPQAALDTLGEQFSRLKPWAAMAQLAVAEYLPELAAGKQPLDIALYASAAEKGKQTGGLESVDEQIAYFEALTIEEQVRLLRSSVEEAEAARASGSSLVEPMVEAYLGGNTQALLREMTRHMEKERELKTKLLSTLITKRNQILADRIVAKRAANAGKRCFFAVGALHLAGENGIPALLEKQGLRTTRVGAVEAVPQPLAAPAPK